MIVVVPTNPDLSSKTEDQSSLPRKYDAGVQASSQDPPMAQSQDKIARGQALKSNKRQKHVQISEAEETISNSRVQDASISRQSLAVPPAPAPAPTPSPSPPLSLSSKILSHDYSSTRRIKVEAPISIDTFLGILARAPLLCTITVTLSLDAAQQKHLVRNVFWHSLESLYLNVSINPKSLLESLALHSLTRLTIDARHGSFAREDMGLHQLLVNSGCALTRLALIDVYPTRAELMRCLRTPACATLQTLVVRSTVQSSALTPYVRRYVDAGMLRDLARVEADGELLCPKLEKLELSYCHCTAEDFVKMVKKRVERGPFAIRYAFLQRDPPSAKVVKELRALAWATKHVFKFKELQPRVISVS
ncbi:hypothetical protein C0993_007242 [Termitomyces sp. T159_Od127]|nr:hypothetical protein C0993_007242 [Termitomyces sp. T159_Od127]